MLDTKTVIFTLFFLIPLIGVGCARSSHQDRSDIHLELAAPLFPPPVGKGIISVRAVDNNGAPIDNAHLAFKADMSHAGMVPVVAETDESRAGVYSVPFEWTMAGDWILTVDMELADGSIATEEFEVRTVIDDFLCTFDTAP
jgi:hypothetical protein